MIKHVEIMKKELTEIRNKLYDRLPSGDISSWELLQAIKLHLDELDGLIDKIDTQCVLSNVVGRSEQLVCKCSTNNISAVFNGVAYCEDCEQPKAN